MDKILPLVHKLVVWLYLNMQYEWETTTFKIIKNELPLESQSTQYLKKIRKYLRLILQRKYFIHYVISIGSLAKKPRFCGTLKQT